jgi:hypothetical protein
MGETSIAEQINFKYLGTPDHPLARMLIDNTRKGIETVLEITPSSSLDGILVK